MQNKNLLNLLFWVTKLINFCRIKNIFSLYFHLDDNESFNSSVDQLDDNVLDDDDIDEETSATGVSNNKRVYDKQRYFDWWV